MEAPLNGAPLASESLPLMIFWANKVEEKNRNAITNRTPFPIVEMGVW
jgi:hypothetical protein